jgi:hypothetical protein
MATIFDEGECQRRHRLCINRAGTCSDTKWSRGIIVPTSVGRCGMKGGTCEFLSKGNRASCICAVMFDV